MSPATIRTKVLVIGGGPAGSTAAKILAENNIDTVLIDKDLSFIKPCGGSIPSTAFQELNIPLDVIKKEIKKIKIVSPKGLTADIGLDSGFIGIVQRGHFDSALRDRAKASGAEIIEAQFNGFHENNKTVLSEAVAAGSLIQIMSDYVIAGDGVNSKTRALIGLKPLQSVFTLSERLDGYPQDSCEFWFGLSHTPQFYSWVFPQPNGTVAGTGSLKADGLKGLLENFLKKRGLEGQGKPRGYRLPLWQKNSRFADPTGKILFVGDAGGQVMPLTFEGMYYAMKSAEFAATAVIEGKPDVYKRLWEKRFCARFQFMKRLWSLFGRNATLIEKFVSLHLKPSVQEASMRLWLDKEADSKSLISYINIFRKILT